MARPPAFCNRLQLVKGYNCCMPGSCYPDHSLMHAGDHHKLSFAAIIRLLSPAAIVVASIVVFFARTMNHPGNRIGISLNGWRPWMIQLRKSIELISVPGSDCSQLPGGAASNAGAG